MKVYEGVLRDAVKARLHSGEGWRIVKLTHEDDGDRRGLKVDEEYAP